VAHTDDASVFSTAGRSAAASRTGEPRAVGTPAVITRVVDGDTVHVRVNGADVTIRVLSVDTPESVSPKVSPECWGPRASAWAKRTLPRGEHVRLRADPSQADWDRYGRVLRYITLPDGRDYSILAAREGMAKPYVYHHHPSREAPQVAGAAQQAKRAGRGLWGPPCHGDVGPRSHAHTRQPSRWH
jgi:micrococcal nuclease